MVFFKKRFETSIEGALLKLLPKDVVSDIIRDYPSSALIEKVVVDTKLCSLESLLKAVSKKLGLDGYLLDLQIPAKSLIKRLGYTEAELEEFKVLPQRTQFGYQLVVSDPEVIDIKEYHAIGVKVLLSTGSAIKQTWARYRNIKEVESSLPTEAQVLGAILKLARYAKNKGAKEVLLGVPDNKHYEFIVEGKTYRGDLSSRMLSKLRILTKQSNKIEWKVRSKSVKSIFIGHIRGSSGFSFYLSWKKREAEESLANKAKVVSSNIDLGYSQVKKSSEIWFIDDDVQFGKLAAQIIESHGLKYRLFFSQNSLFKEFNKLKLLPAAIVCDLHMPGVNGADLIKRIQENFNDVPLLVLTSDDDPNVEANLVELGVSAFIKKSESPRILVAWINNCINKHKKYSLKKKAS